jgi:cytochrome c553
MPAKSFLSLVAVAVALSFTVSTQASADEAAPAGNAARGAKLAYTCLGCHAIADYRNAYPDYHVPKLGGQHDAYIVSALGEYRSGARPHPTMKSQATQMTDENFADIAAYFSTATPAKSGPAPVGSAPKAAEVCQACHGPDGVGILPEYPTLAGQHADYIEQALRAYRKGTRQNAIMQGFAAALSDDDIRALAHYFSTQKPGLWVPALPHG